MSGQVRSRARLAFSRRRRARTEWIVWRRPGQSLIDVLDQAFFEILNGCRQQKVIREILKTLFNRRTKVAIQRLRLFVEGILSSATGRGQLIQTCVQLHQLIAAEFRMLSRVIVGAVNRAGAQDHFLGPGFGSVDRSMRELTLAHVPPRPILMDWFGSALTRISCARRAPALSNESGA